MTELTEDRMREIVKEEIAKVNITIEFDGKTVAQTIVDEIRERTGKRMSNEDNNKLETGYQNP